MIKAIDFFCGAGGLTRGLLDAGVSVVAGVDNDERLRRTYEANNAPSRFVHRDLRSVDAGRLLDELEIRRGDTTVYAACTPCQPFSSLNPSKSGDERKALLLDFARIVAARPPDFIIVENVPGLHNALGRATYTRFIEELTGAGFLADSDLLDAKDFGVPQTRKRFLLVAARHRRPSLPAPTTAGNPATVRSAISAYPPLEAGEVSPTVPNHAARRLPPHHRRIVEAVPPDGGSRSEVADPSILLACHRRNPKAHKEVFGRVAWDAPGPTMTCRCTDVYCGRFVHPEQHRGLSHREAAALQTFGDDYEFFGDSFLEKSRQIGNAVPVLLSRELGAAARRCLGGAEGRSLR